MVNFSTALDMNKLVKAGLVSSNWDAGPTGGMVTDSIVSFIVRKGNPDHIKTWTDLVKSGVQVITPNPFSSGSAKWNLMAAYGAQLALGQDQGPGGRLPGQAPQERRGPADQRQHRPADLPVRRGRRPLGLRGRRAVRQAQGRSDHNRDPAAVDPHPEPDRRDHQTAADPAAAKAFLNYLLSPAGQKVWGQQGYRPVLAKVAAEFHFPKPKKLFTITSLGGWTSVNTKFFNTTTGIVAKIGAGAGGLDGEWLTSHRAPTVRSRR